MTPNRKMDKSENRFYRQKSDLEALELAIREGGLLREEVVQLRKENHSLRTMLRTLTNPNSNPDQIHFDARALLRELGEL